MPSPHRRNMVVVAALLLLAGCGAVGDINTKAMQATNRAGGAPLNGPGNPPSPATQAGH